MTDQQKRRKGRPPALTQEQAERARSLYKLTNMSLEQIGARYGVSQGVIDAVVMRRSPYN